MLPVLTKIDNLELVGIASGSGLSAAHAARKFGFEYAAQGADEIWNDPEINTVAVLTRHFLHASQVISALKAGKHVFVEKPLAINQVQLGEIQSQMAVDPSRLLMVGFNRRFSPMGQQLHNFFVQRTEPLFIHYRVNAGEIPLIHWLHDPEIGGGRIIGEGCHFVDFLTYLVGDPPVSVTAQGLPDQGRYREDNVVVNINFPDGSIGTITYLANGDKALPKERVEVFSGGRVGILDDYRKLETILHNRRGTMRSHLRQDKGHRSEWEAFAQSVISEGGPPIPYGHLFGVTKATFAAVEALRTGESIRI